jgi:hypothetical protein
MKIFRHLIFVLLGLMSAQSFAATPPGLPLMMPDNYDPFSIAPPSDSRTPRAAEDKQIVTNIDVLGTKTEISPFTTPPTSFSCAPAACMCWCSTPAARTAIPTLAVHTNM